MKSIFKHKSVTSFPSFPPVGNEDVIFHIGAPKTGSSAIQKFCLDNRGKLQQARIYYPEHGLDKNSISGGHSTIGQALIDNRPDEAGYLLKSYVAEAKKNNCTLLLSAESLFYSPEKLSDIVGGFKYKIIAFYREPLEALYSNYNQMIKRHFLTADITKYCRQQVENQNAFLTSESHAKWLKIHGRNRLTFVDYCEDILKISPIQRHFLLALGIHSNQVTKDFEFKSRFLNRSYPLRALELKRLLNFVLSNEFEAINDKIDFYLQGLADQHVETHCIKSRVSNELYACLQKATQTDFKHQVENVLFELGDASTTNKETGRPVNAMQLNVEMFELLLDLSVKNPQLFMMLRNRVEHELISDKPIPFEVFKLAELFNLKFESRDSEWFTKDQVSRMPSYEKVEFLRDIADLMFRRGSYCDAEKVIDAALEIRPHGPVINAIKARIDKALNK
ncbi:hypothetical protein [Alteromonas stellipolaris]|uniref:hypothetical protein n=1 Tax=Alteromonas stellipolaris TaxID=233316 RepID=UPI002493F84C|nr:hypothetical protein [Alteromonas stellipolaris]